MQIKAGIWIDQQQAVVVHLVNGKERVIHFTSQITAHNTSMFNQQSLHGDQQTVLAQRAEKVKNQLHKFYKKVAYAIENAEQIFIFGPDMARIELKKEMKKSKERFTKIVSVERADKMNETHIISKVKAFFND